uniref:HECT domain-containing protein n=1 Tax=Oryzias latipes TaxID=8090 RepID=A0A3P9HTJ3_ORYLA
MQRSFPAIFSGNRARFKRKAPDAPRPTCARLLELQFCLLPNNSSRTPRDETVLLQAGLGRRTVTIADDADHAEINRVLLEEFSKLQSLRGGWLLQKATGGSGQRKMAPLPQSSNGYSSKILKSSSNNGKNTIYIVPLQETIDTAPLPYNAPEFDKMPKNDCMTCGTSIPLELLSLHIESCQCVDLEPGAGEESDGEPVTGGMDSCPICGETFPTDLMPLHASSCGESFPQMDYVTQIPVEPSTSRGVPISSSIPESSSSSNFSLLTFSSPQSRSSQPSPAGNDAWKRAEDPERASVLYRRFLLEQKEDEPTLKVTLDLRESVEEQEERLISFYKVHKVDWARPLHCRLEGDVATGEGVKRHFFSLVIQKLQTGFSLDFGNRTGTLLFEGQADHLTPSTSKVLLQSDLFKMAGRMIGHSFLHGGPPLTGISPAILHVLLGSPKKQHPLCLKMWQTLTSERQ